MTVDYLTKQSTEFYMTVVYK